MLSRFIPTEPDRVRQRGAGPVRVAAVSVLLALIMSLSACVATTVGREPTPVQYMEMARSELAAGNPLVAVTFLTDQLKTGDSEAKRLLRSNPSVRTALTQRIREETEGVESVGDALRTKRRIDLHRLIYEDDAEADALFANLGEELLRKARAGLIVIDPTDDTSAFPALQQPDIQQIGWQSTIAGLQNDPTNLDRSLLQSALSQASQRSTEERAKLLPILEATTLSRAELEKAKEAFPEFAERRLAEMSVRIHLDTQPHDRLLLEDLRSRLGEQEGLILVDAGDKPQLRVVVSQLRWDLLQIPERTETVS